MKYSIDIFSAHVINQQEWDACVAMHSNGLIYAQYDYLDRICDHWSGLVIGDYKAIIPLPWRRKYGFRYYYIPPFIQQLGFIGDISLLNSLHEELIKKIRSYAWYGDLHLNFSNHLLASELHCNNRTNFVIDLHRNYLEIYQAYHPDLKQLLLKIPKASFYYSKEHTITDTIRHYQQQYASRMPHLSLEDFARIDELCRFYASKNDCIIRSALKNDGTILSDTLLLKDERRIYHLLNTTFPEGRELNSNPWLLDQVLREFSDQHILFDFEGSDLPGVKNFYKKFGGHVQPYFHYRRNLWH
ncbi:MAG: hypothetical protein IBJ16_10770 [Chitinophagaceae bacterium]|nr:hypothetical protein [Chitinophagaceae bacterium]